MMQDESKDERPKVVSSEVVFKESFFRIKCDQLEVNASKSYCYYSLVTPPQAVNILAITSEGLFILVKEYRHPTGHVLLGLPGGFVDPGEDPIKAAERELLEETGYHAESFTLMGSAYPYAGISSQKTLYFLAHQARLREEPHLEISEIIKVKLLKPDAIKKEIALNQALDGTLCTSLFFYSLLRE